MRATKICGWILCGFVLGSLFCPGRQPSSGGIVIQDSFNRVSPPPWQSR